MPTFNDFLKPIILPQSAGDMEEARIRRLMDLAKLEQLRRELGLQERQVSLAERSAKTNETLGFANLSLDQKKTEVAKFLADNNVKHDAAALSEANRHNVATETQGQKQIDASRQTQIFGDLSRMAVTDPMARTKLIADYMAENGDPSLQKVLAATEAAAPKPKGDYSEGTPATPTTSSSVDETLKTARDSWLLKAVTDVPLAASNLGGQLYNYGIAAPNNLINSMIGLPKAPTAIWADTYAEALAGKKLPGGVVPPVIAPTKTGPVVASRPVATPPPKNFYDGPPGYPDTRSAKKKARDRGVVSIY